MNTTDKTPIEQMNEDLKNAPGVEFRPVTEESKAKARAAFKMMGVDGDVTMNTRTEVKKIKSDNEQKLKPVDDDEVPFDQLPEEQKELFIEVMTRSGLDASQLK